MVALDESGRPSFQRLQQRAKLTRALDIRRAAVENPVTFFAFDLLAVDDFDVRPLPLAKRKELLRKLLPQAGLIRFLDHFEGEGEVLYEQVQKLGLEGIVAKRADSPYRAGRSSSWIKIRTRRSDDFVVVGFSAPKGARTGFGGLQLAQYVDGELVYSGRAGSGFTGAQLAEVRARLDEIRRPDPPCSGPIPKEKGITWVEPRLVCEVEFTEWTDEGLLRQPVFLRFRDDKRPEECVGSGEAGKRGSEEAEHMETVVTKAPEPRSEPPIVNFTNLKKIFWPDEGYTKGDLIEYYRSIGPWILPYLADRPVVLTRYPDGINGKSFFQKDAPGFVPDWIRTERMWSEQAEREIDYFICDDEAGLLYLANLGTIPLHVWASRTASIDRPDWCVLDLDPKDAPFSDVIPGCPDHSRALRRDRAAQLREDQWLVRPPRADPPRRSVQLRRGAQPGRAPGPGDRGGAARHHHPHPTGLPPRGEGIYRLPAEWCRAAAGGAVQRAAAARCPGVHAASLERGKLEAGYPDLHYQERGGPDEEAEAGPAA